MNQLPTQTKPYSTPLFLTGGTSGQPEKRAGVSTTSRFHFQRDIGESIFRTINIRHGESRKTLFLVDGGVRAHDSKNPIILPSSSLAIKVIEGITIVRLTPGKKGPINRLPKLSLLQYATALKNLQLRISGSSFRRK